MKAIRHAKIKDIIENSVVETQEDLAESLRKQHIEVTQATVSRDIKELMLIKVPTGDGRYRYAYPMEKNMVFSKNRMARMFQDSVIGLNFSENIIVIKTLPGAANAVASTLDYAKWPEIIGTVAGDDNILVVIKPIGAVPEIIKKLEMMIV
jgi:transcriptional regulator of arginine metabolism